MLWFVLTGTTVKRPRTPGSATPEWEREPAVAREAEATGTDISEWSMAVAAIGAADLTRYCQ